MRQIRIIKIPHRHLFPKLQTVFTVAKEVARSHSQEDWSRIKMYGANRIQRHVEGHFDRRSLIARTQISELGHELQATIIEWMEETDEAALRIFLKRTTGLSVLPQYLRFEGQPEVKADLGILPHTCAFTIDVNPDITAEQLLVCLNEWTIEDENHGIMER